MSADPIKEAVERVTKRAEHLERSFLVPDLHGSLDHKLHNVGAKSDHEHAADLRTLLSALQAAEARAVAAEERERVLVEGLKDAASMFAQVAVLLKRSSPRVSKQMTNMAADSLALTFNPETSHEA